MIFDPAACRKIWLSSVTGTALRRDHVFQDVAGSDARKLVDVADKDGPGIIGDGFEQPIHELRIDHAGFVDDDQIAVQRVFIPSFEAASLEIELQKTVDCGCLSSCDLCHPLRCATCRCSQNDFGGKSSLLWPAQPW